MTGFPDTVTEVSTAFHEGRRKGFFPKTGELFECLKSQVLFYEKSGPPHKKSEEWRYFPFKKAFLSRYPFPPSYDEFVNKESVLIKGKPPLLQSSTVLEIKDTNIPKNFQMEGLKVWSWKQFLAGEVNPGPEIKEKIFESLREKRDSLCSLNNLFSKEGVILSVEKSLKTPLEIQFLSNSFDGQKNLQFRIFLFIKKNTKAKILETFYGSAPQNDRDFSTDVSITNDPMTVNSTAKKNLMQQNSHNRESSLLFHLQTDCFVEKEAELDYIHLDQSEKKDVFLNQFFGNLNKKARGCFLTMSLKAGLSRYEIYLKQRKKSYSEVRGLSFVNEKRLTEHRVSVSHLEEEGFSNQLYQSLIFDSASHIFKGLIFIDKEAQKTEAYQLNKNLLLGEKAFSASSPELDVLADNVKAHHGASISSLEENRELLFYLQSRGLSYEKAFELMLFGSILELLSITEKNIKNVLLNLIQDFLKNSV